MEGGGSACSASTCGRLGGRKEGEGGRGGDREEGEEPTPVTSAE